MALQHSPKIVTKGLVFAYDMANTDKSWKGKPSTNYVNTTPTWGGDGVNQTAFTKGYVEVTDPSLMYNGLKTFLWSPGDSLNCYLQSDDIVGGTGTTSATWTFSCYVRAQDRRAITSMNVYMYFPSSDGSAAGTITDAGNGWYRISRTRTGTASYISLFGFTGFAANVKYYLSGAMLTKDGIVVGPLNGSETRTDTQAILDITKNNTITATSLTYNSDGTFSFDGINNYLTNSTNIIKNSGGWTVENWFKLDVVNSGSLYNFIGDATILYNSWYWTIYQSKLALWNRSPGIWKYGSTTILPNVWYCASIVCNDVGTGYQFYLNGIPEGGDHVSYSWNASYAPLQMGYIGRGDAGNGRYFGGSLPCMKVYNRALSAEEVNQNFNALRGRYGI